ncbi:MAG: hypothetical protein APR63_01920 [Desulfuromonas sp. SDB]|nr:MAG: hypothetical protein APR63_01920 [Desulfuromonas sp. SDB]
MPTPKKKNLNLNFMRINKFLVRAKIAPSRRKADQLINAELVEINHRIAKCGDMVDPQVDQVCFKGRKISINDNEKKYIALYKPRGYICSHRKYPYQLNILDLLPPGIRWIWSGRLDKPSEGLMLVSNDGYWIDRVTHPSYQVDRVYQVELKTELTDAQRAKLEKGIMDKGELLKAKKVVGKGTDIKIVLSAGKNRQVRRMIKNFNIEILNLKRIEHGIVHLNHLKPGQCRNLNRGEIDYFFNLTKQNKSCKLTEN